MSTVLEAFNHIALKLHMNGISGMEIGVRSTELFERVLSESPLSYRVQAESHDSRLDGIAVNFGGNTFVFYPDEIDGNISEELE